MDSRAKMVYGQSNMQRETTYERLAVEAGEMIPSANMRDRAKMGNASRLPVVYEDSAGRWYWCGLRAPIPPALSHVAVKGRRWKVEKMVKAVRGLGNLELYVATDPRAPMAETFHAPRPIETVEDAEEYYRGGVNPQFSPAQIARSMGWRRHGSLEAAQDLFKAVIAKRHGREVPPECFQRVKFPGRAESVERTATWQDVARELVANREALAAVRADLAALREDMGKQSRETAAQGRRLDGAASKRTVEHLAEQVESLTGQVESLAALV